MMIPQGKPHDRLDSCALCSDSEQEFEKSFSYIIHCVRCGSFMIEGMLCNILYSITDKQLLPGVTREHWELNGEPLSLDIDHYQRLVKQAPATIPEKAHKLLAAVERRTKAFGDPVALAPGHDYPLAYARHAGELDALLEYLTERGCITQSASSDGREVRIKAFGFEDLESRRLLPPLTVFISSTCDDLIDLRAELSDFLTSKGFTVKRSDDPYQITLNGTANPIEVCLQNVDSAHVVVCIPDCRYGRVLPPDDRFSATHTEIRHAREKKRPTYIFIRQQVLAEFHLLCKNRNAKTKWVEPRCDKNRKRWVEFIKELRESDRHTDYNTWSDPFETVVDLKRLVLQRLAEHQRSATQRKQSV